MKMTYEQFSHYIYSEQFAVDFCIRRVDEDTVNIIVYSPQKSSWVNGVPTAKKAVQHVLTLDDFDTFVRKRLGVLDDAETKGIVKHQVTYFPIVSLSKKGGNNVQ